MHETVVFESQLDMGTAVGDVWVDEGFAYVARFGDNGVSIVDVRDPTDPQPASVYDSPETAGTWDVKAARGFAYVAPQYSGYGLVILDVSDPFSPQLVTNYSHPRVTSTHNVWVDEERSVVYLASNTTGEVEVVDVSDPADPLHLGSFGAFSGDIHDVVVRNDILYASFLDGGLYLGSVAGSPVPTFLGSVDYPDAFTHNAWPTMDGDYVLTTDEYTGAYIRIWDVSSPQNIVQAATYRIDAGTTPHNVLVRNRYAFISYYTAGLVVLDISEPENPVEVGMYDTYPGPGGGFDGAWGVYPYDDHVYVSDIEGGLFIFSFKPVSLVLSELPDQVARGEVLSYRATVEEKTDFPLTFRGLSSVVLPNGNEYGGNPVFGPLTFDIEPLGLISGRIRHDVPFAAPLGSYEYRVRVEDEQGFRLGSESFTLEIVD
jgi:choice-of-anchor B domain-containing protein